MELLVVVAVLAIAVSFAVLETGAVRGRLLEDTARQLAATTTLAEQEAILRSRPLGIAFYRHAYRIVQFDNTWSAPSAEPLYRARLLPDGIEFVGAALRAPNATDGQLHPGFVMLPDGDTTLNEVLLADTFDGRTLHLVAQDGRLHIATVSP